MVKKNIFLLVIGITIILLTVLPLTKGLSAPNAVITLNPSQTYQTIKGWEATTQAGQSECQGFDSYKDALFDQAVNDLGINRLRVEIKSNIENPVDYFSQWRAKQLTFAEWKSHWYEAVNDNSDPLTVNPGGFQFSELDDKIRRVVLPIKQRVEARAEHLYISVNYVDFGASAFEHKEHPEEYGELVLAVYQHMQSQFGWVPDSWEVILEPDTGSASWSATQIRDAVGAASARLQSNGFTPRFIAPSTASADKAVPYFDQIAVASNLPYLMELSYHRYGGVSDSVLQQIGAKAAQSGVGAAMLEHIGSGYEDLHKDLKLANVSSWQEYTLAFCTNDNGAQYFYVQNVTDLQMGSRTRFLRQYMKFIRAGAVRIQAGSDTDTFDPVAFINSNGGYVVVVKANQGGSFVVQGLPAGVYGIKYTTNSLYDIDLADVTLNGVQSLNANIPELGVMTIYAKSTTGQTPPPEPTTPATIQPQGTPSYLPMIVAKAFKLPPIPKLRTGG